MIETSNEERKIVRQPYLLMAGAAVLIAVISFTTMWLMKMNRIVHSEVIYPGISVENIALKGLSYTEAEKLLHSKLTNHLQQHRISLVYQENKWSFNYDKMGVQYDFKKSLKDAYKVGREGNLFERYLKIQEVSQHPQNFAVQYFYDESYIKGRISEISRLIDQEPKNAILRMENGRFYTQSGMNGIRVDQQIALEEIKEKLVKKEEGTVQLIVEDVAPRIQEKDLQTIKEKINEFSTVFNSWDVGRTENLRVAASKVNGTVLMPGDVFSLDKTLGSRNALNGYKPAKVIVNNELVDGMAGGICQVATTIYNASLLSNLQIVERSPHSLRTSYIALGRDATLAENLIDFKFKNNYDFPIYIEAKVFSSQVYVAFYGTKKYPNRSITFETEVLKKYPPTADEIVKDPTLYVGQTQVEKRGIEGVKVRLYKIVSEEGRVLSKEPVDVSYYPPIRGRIRVGAKLR